MAVAYCQKRGLVPTSAAPNRGPAKKAKTSEAPVTFSEAHEDFFALLQARSDEYAQKLGAGPSARSLAESFVQSMGMGAVRD
jgi:hypothetical protein